MGPWQSQGVLNRKATQVFKVAPAVTSRRAPTSTATSAPPVTSVRHSATFVRHAASRLLVVLLLACAPLFGLASTAQAHNVLIGSNPKDGARLSAVPDRVTLTFDQPVRADFAKIVVTGPGGSRYEEGEVGVRGDDVGISIQGSGPSGEYVIGYRIVSNDGHPVTGTITFTVTAAGAAAGGPTTGAKPAPAVPAMGSEARVVRSSGSWVWGLFITTAALLALATLVLVRHDRRMRNAAA